MPVTSILAHGVTVGCPPRSVNVKPPERGECQGWTTHAARRNTRWLQSVDETKLDGYGYAVTLTVRTCPESPKDWARLRKVYIDRLKRMGMTRLHWVTEWQKRGVPHLHMAVWFNEASDKIEDSLIDHWIAITRPTLGTAVRSQHVGKINGFMGWAQYVAKHTSRGMAHYQRSPLSRPPGWQSTGRIWGYRGQWVNGDPDTYEMSSAGFHQYRRLIGRWSIAQARARGRSGDIRRAKQLLKCTNPALSGVKGVTRWIPESVAQQMLCWLLINGYEVHHADTAKGRRAGRLEARGRQ